MTTETVQYDADGNITGKQLSTRQPTATEQLKALQMLSKLTGEDDAAKARGELISSSMKKLTRELMRRAEKDVTGHGGKHGGGDIIHSPPEIRGGKMEAPPEAEDE